ncbi:MAG: nicotinamide-nucleotide amidohydrolase family protein, partial [Pseudomonadota bacterium]|nr:nicotinamide-nucleotide amidohydrolase family protein [Pseudomonadota bacterium]
MSDLEPLVVRLGVALLARPAMLVTAESCTGGLVAAACTAMAGSSRWFERGFVTYSNAAKSDLLGVDPALLETCGAVSSQVAQAMAAGALARAPAGYAVAVTGIAGPEGGSMAKPVGTVWLAVAAARQPPLATLLQASGDRGAIRAQSVRRALELV